MIQENCCLLLDDEGMLILLPNEFILSKWHANSNTLIIDLREIKLLYQGLQISLPVSPKIETQNRFRFLKLYFQNIRFIFT